MNPAIKYVNYFENMEWHCPVDKSVLGDPRKQIIDGQVMIISRKECTMRPVEGVPGTSVAGSLDNSAIMECQYSWDVSQSGGNYFENH